VIPEALHAKWEKLKDLRSQADFERSPEKLLEWLIELGLDKVDPERREARREKRMEPKSEPQDGRPVSPARASSAAELPRRRISNPYPAFPTLRDRIFKRDGSRCTYVSPITGKRCDSTHALEIDHIQPRALGGLDAPDNLRVYCDAHNRARATRQEAATISSRKPRLASPSR